VCMCVWVSISMHDPLWVNKSQETIPLCNTCNTSWFPGIVRVF
jgi:hypothetical protein